MLGPGSSHACVSVRACCRLHDGLRTYLPSLASSAIITPPAIMLFALMLLLFNPESALAAFRGLKQFGRPGDVVLKTTLPDFVQASQASSDDASKRFEGMMSSFIDPTAYRAARSSVDGLRASTAESYKQQSAFPFPSFSPSPSSTQQQANPYATKQPAAQNPEPSPTSTNNGRLDSTEKEDDPPPAASNKEVVPSISKETSKILHFYK